MTDIPMTLELVSHPLCPYVQRAAILLSEKSVPFTRTDIDLADKPDWFRAISPLGKVPLLRVDGVHVLFESAVICEYLDEVLAPRLHPAEPLARARERAWVEIASATLNDIWGTYTAADETAFDRKAGDLRGAFERAEQALDAAGPFFAGARFGLVDAAFAPVFRYFDAFDRRVTPSMLQGLPRVASWRAALAGRPSVRQAVPADYPQRLDRFLWAQPAHLARLLAADQSAAATGAWSAPV